MLSRIENEQAKIQIDIGTKRKQQFENCLRL